MANNSFRLQAKRQADGVVLVKALIRHPNDNGLGRTAEGQPIPPHHLTQVVVSVNDQPVATLHSGSGLAANPLLGWKINARDGDRIAVSWLDNLDETGRAETIVA
ncbi:MAG TPA: thiosulfate oxidation carrier complex protein SoxZ [Magnetospirillum sp.]|nr:thiosulfate oxidation carrier complex protein SoxZ [Magnetospirillum sp.]